MYFEHCNVIGLIQFYKSHFEVIFEFLKMHLFISYVKRRLWSIFAKQNLNNALDFILPTQKFPVKINIIFTVFPTRIYVTYIIRVYVNYNIIFWGLQNE